MSKNAPKTVELLKELATLKSRYGWTFKELREHLNQHLEEKIPDTNTGCAQIERWLATDRDTWCEPRAEIILAVQKVIERFKL